MFLYTTQTAQMIFPPKDYSVDFMWFNGDGVESHLINGKRVVSRLISTNPKKYLDPLFTPGREFKN